MDRYPYARPDRWWSPLPSRVWTAVWDPICRYQQVVQFHVRKIEVSGLEHLRAAKDRGYGVLVTPNHASHADCFLLLRALRRLGGHYYILTAWQVFALMGWISRLAYRHYGCFSVDREATDLKAYRQSVDILANSSDPLVIFPEGEVYHLNDHPKPFRPGTFSIAATAIRRSGRPVACVPCALKYRYLSDPTPELLPVIAQIEAKLGASPSSNAEPLANRIERLIEETVAWREEQYLGQGQDGPLLERIDRLSNAILQRLESRYAIGPTQADVPDRVKKVRQKIIALDNMPDSPSIRRSGDTIALEDAFVATQLYSYEPGYVAEHPSIERIAETVDKLEEDVLGVRSATVRGNRRGLVQFGEPIILSEVPDRQALARVQDELQQRVQGLLDELR